MEPLVAEAVRGEVSSTTVTLSAYSSAIQPSGLVSKSIFHQIYGTPEREAGVGPPITVPESPGFLLPAIVPAGVVRMLTPVLFILTRSPIWNLDETGEV